MPSPSLAESALRDARPEHALKLLQEQIRSAPADPKLRVFLFQLLCVLGHWDRALNQLTVTGELDASTLAMVHAKPSSVSDCVRVFFWDNVRRCSLVNPRSGSPC